MSASRERKKRQEYFAGGGVDKKAAREAERKAAERRSNLFYGAIAVVFVVGTVALLLINSGIFKRSATAVTVGDDTYTAADLSYYYMAAYSQLYNQYGDLISYIGLDTTQPFSSQAAWGSTEEDAQTWDEYFKEQAVEMMKFVTAANTAAEAEGFQLSAEAEQSIADAIQEMKDAAKSNGVSYKTQLTAYYGSLMTSGIFEENVREYYTAAAYEQAYLDSLTYTDEDLEAAYAEDPDAYDKVSYQLVTIDGAAPSTEDEEGNEVEPTEEESAAAWEDAKKTAQLILDAYDSGESLETAAEDFDTASYSSSDAATSTSTAKYVQWCFEDGRQVGDEAVLEDESGSKVYVVTLVDRYRVETKTVNVRHILVTDANVETDGETEVTDEEIKAKAEEILAMWDGTEEGFAQLAREYSQDGNASSGGIYEDVPVDYMVDTFNDWIFDDARQAGDTGIVKTDYGYHIIYFISDGPASWKVDVENTLKNEALTEWQTALVEPYEAVTDEKGMSYVAR